MSGIDQLGYIGFEVSDLDAWEHFGTQVLGVVVSERFEGGFSLRNDSYKHRIFIHEGPADDLEFVGLQVADADALAAVGDRLRSSGVEVRAGTADEVAARDVGGLSVLHDPAGNRLELHYGSAMADEPFVSPIVHSGFVADDMGFGHCVLRADDLDVSTQFYCDLMGFKLSDHVVTKIGPYEINIAFTHMNKRHHSVALGCNLPKRIHHFMLQAGSLDDVGLAFDRTVDAQMRVTQTIGRHPNDRMVSFYAHTPSGFEFEYGWGAIDIDDTTWEPSVHHRISEWGHRRPPYQRPKDQR
jgi:biphenyl-2,3-diol 1,2-dioxygenase